MQCEIVKPDLKFVDTDFLTLLRSEDTITTAALPAKCGVAEAAEPWMNVPIKDVA